MGTTLSLDQALEQLTQLPDQFATETSPEPITITQRGHPVMVIVPWELFESLTETLDILGDAEMLAELRRGEDELARGEVRS